jgi:hypothetical protein
MVVTSVLARVLSSDKGNAAVGYLKFYMDSRGYVLVLCYFRM